jgi:hypothetical protein
MAEHKMKSFKTFRNILKMKAADRNKKSPTKKEISLINDDNGPFEVVL